MADDLDQKSLTPVAAIAGGDVMHAPVEQFTTGGLAQAYLLLGMFEKMIEKRKEEFRARLLKEAEAGKQEESGTFNLAVDGNTVTKEKRVTKKLDLEKVQALLEAHNLPLSAGCDSVVTLVPNYSKLLHLVDIGKLAKKDLDAVQGKVSWALKVTASEQFDQLLEQLKAAQKQLK